MKKEILFIMPCLIGGGAEKVLIDILRNFDYDRYSVTLILDYKHGTYLKDVPQEVELISVHGPTNIWHERLNRISSEHGLFMPLHKWVYGTIMRWKLRGRKFDTIISFMEGDAVKYHSYITRKAKRNLSWVHIDLEKKHWSKDFFKNDADEIAAYQAMDNIVFVSEDARRSMYKLFPSLDIAKSRVVYNLIDAENVRQLSEIKTIFKKKFTICMTGRLNPQKRYDRALEAMKMLKDDGYDFELWILGEGSEEAKLKEITNNLGIENHVKFLGFQRPPYPYMKEADIYLNTSEAEGYPLVVCEAMCLGLPVVATDICGSREILKNNDCGMLVEESPEAIYKGIKTLLDNAELREEMKGKALLASKNFEVSNVMDQIYDLL